jgi:hypothetical protein
MGTNASRETADLRVFWADSGGRVGKEVMVLGNLAVAWRLMCDLASGRRCIMIERVWLAKWMVPWWWKVAYKIPAPISKIEREWLEIQPDEKFQEIVSGHVVALLEKGIAPPEEIATTIYNMANDFVNGQEMIIRTGDYIALQKHIRKM